jgi:hypothetical protein
VDEYLSSAEAVDDLRWALQEVPHPPTGRWPVEYVRAVLNRLKERRHGGEVMRIRKLAYPREER